MVLEVKNWFFTLFYDLLGILHIFVEHLFDDGEVVEHILPECHPVALVGQLQIGGVAAMARNRIIEPLRLDRMGPGILVHLAVGDQDRSLDLVGIVEG